MQMLDERAIARWDLVEATKGPSVRREDLDRKPRARGCGEVWEE